MKDGEGAADRKLCKEKTERVTTERVTTIFYLNLTHEHQ